MVHKTKGFSLGGRLEWLVLVLVFLIGLLLGDAFRSRGIFRVREDNFEGKVKSFLVKKAGPPTSISHVQFNFHVVAPGVWRSAQVTPESLDRMKTYGLKSLVNLRLAGDVKPWENEMAKQLGIQPYHFPMTAGEVVPPKTIDAVLSILADPARRPVLVHCAAGKDRTGMILAAYRIVHSGWPFSDIYQEMMMYGYDSASYPKILESLRLWSEARGRPEMAQEIALVEREISEQKKATSI